MDAITAASVGDLATLIPSFERSLRAANKSPKTVQVYGEAANQLPGPSRGNLRCPLARWARAARHRGHPLGWRTREMLSRYGASAADERARAAYQARSPGDRL